jgi:hypothetical protein
LATFWAIFSQTHLVTLVPAKNRLSSESAPFYVFLCCVPIQTGIASKIEDVLARAQCDQILPHFSPDFLKP